MRKHSRNSITFAALTVGFLSLLTSPWARGYEAEALVTFEWATSGVAPGWYSAGPNSLTTMSNDTYFSTLSGYGYQSYFDADFASSAYCTGLGVTYYGSPDTFQVRKYGCRFVYAGFYALPPADLGPPPAASGTLAVTDTTLTGTLTVLPTTGEPIGATTTFISGIRVSNSEGNGATGYNQRYADGSPFGNAWYGVSSSATLQVNLTGTFTSSSWNITGGTVRLTDPDFACQTGANGPSTLGILCTPATTYAGAFQANGAHLSWGWDLDGAGSVYTSNSPIEVRDATGTGVVATLSGVRAELSLDGGGNISTDTGEVRWGLGSSSSGCPTHIRWTGTAIVCGQLNAADLVITGTVASTDTTPDPFSFTDLTDVPLNTVVSAGPVTITGLTASAPVTVSGTGGSGASIGCTGSYAAGPIGYISNGEQICVRHTSAGSGETTVGTTVTIGSVSDTFESTTGDNVPAAFVLTDQTGVPLLTLVESAPVTISGMTITATVSVSGGWEAAYSVNAGPYTSLDGTVSNGDSVRVRHRSAATGGVATDTLLTIGGVSDTFTSTTVADTTPDSFAFIDVINVPRNSTTTSNAVTIAGINAAAAISVSGAGEYSINCTATFTTSSGTIQDGETVCVRHVNSNSYNTATSTTLTVGGVSDTYTSTTVLDTNPDPFTFVDQPGVPMSTVIVSAPVVIQGFDTTTVWSTGGEHSIGCTGSNWTSASTPLAGPGPINICVRHTSAATSNTATNTVLNVGSTSDTFTSVTIDTDPDAFSFIDVTGVALGTLQESNCVAVNGLAAAAPISVSGTGSPPGSSYQYSIGCTGSWTSLAGSITDGQTVKVRHTSSASNSGTVNTTLTIGTVSDTFSSTTASDTTPDQYADQQEVQIPIPLDNPPPFRESAAFVVKGINGPAAISVSGSTTSGYSIGCTGSYISGPDFIGTPNQGIGDQINVCVRHRQSALPGGRVYTRLSVGTINAEFSSVTEVPAPTAGDGEVEVNTAVVTSTNTEGQVQAQLFPYDPEEPPPDPPPVTINVSDVTAVDTAVVGTCEALEDPRWVWNSSTSQYEFDAVYLPVAALAGPGGANCPALLGETASIPPYMRGFLDDTVGSPTYGKRLIYFSTIVSDVEFDGIAVQQAISPPSYIPTCNATLESRPITLWGARVGEIPDGGLYGEDQTLQNVTIQCNGSRGGTAKLSNTGSLEFAKDVLGYQGYLARHIKDINKVLLKLGKDDDACTDPAGDQPALSAVTPDLLEAAGQCGSASVIPNILRDTSYPAQRISRNIYQYKIKLTLTNNGADYVTGAKVRVRSSTPATQVYAIDDPNPPILISGNNYLEFVFGIVDSYDTHPVTRYFLIRQDRSKPVDLGVLIPYVEFVPSDPQARYEAARLGCQQLARIAATRRASFRECPDRVTDKDYRGTLISLGLTGAQWIWERLEIPGQLGNGAYCKLQVPDDIVDPVLFTDTGTPSQSPGCPVQP